ncbi:hypothetical protein PENTCL1PPCAC_29790, partial [Pristionchus entomophagus]
CEQPKVEFVRRHWSLRDHSSRERISIRLRRDITPIEACLMPLLHHNIGELGRNVSSFFHRASLPCFLDRLNLPTGCHFSARPRWKDAISLSCTLLVALQTTNITSFSAVSCA